MYGVHNCFAFAGCRGVVRNELFVLLKKQVSNRQTFDGFSLFRGLFFCSIFARYCIDRVCVS